MLSLLDKTLGALEIGILISTFLYGIYIVQAFIYSQADFKDMLWLKWLVLFVLILETAQTFCTCFVLYHLTVTNYGVEASITEPSFVLDFTATLSSWIGAVVQAFFAYRVKVLSGRLLIPVISWGLSLFRATLGTVIGVTIFRSPSLTAYTAKYEWLNITVLAVSTATDVLNTTSLCYCLLKRRSAFAQSNKTVDKIILYTTETGLITCLTGLVILVCAVAMPNNLIYIGVVMPYAKLFSNSFMASLNARQVIRSQLVNGSQSLQNSAQNRRHRNSSEEISLQQHGAVALELSKISLQTDKRFGVTDDFP